MRKAPFQLSPAAKTRIRAFVDECLLTKGIRGVPALVWLDSAANNGLFPSHPALGLYDVREHIADSLYDCDGLEIGVAMSDTDFARIRGRTIDYSDTSGMFVG